MHRRPPDSLIALAAALLLVMGQSFLLIPHHQRELLAGLPVTSVLVLGFLFHFVGMAGLSTIVVPFNGQKAWGIYILLMLSLAAITLLYANGGREAEALLFGGLLIAILFSLLTNGDALRAEQAPLNGFALFLNLVVGMSLLIWPSLDQTGSYRFGDFQQTASSVVFILSAVPGGIVPFLSSRRSARVAVKMTAVPWLGWSLLSALSRNMAGLIPGIGMALTLLTADLIPWPRLKLPQNDLLGKRIILLTAILQTIFLAAVIFLLNPAEIAQVSTISGWGFLQLSNREFAFLLMIGTEALLLYSLATLTAAIHGLTLMLGGAQPNAGALAEEQSLPWNKQIDRLINPFAVFLPNIRKEVDLQAQQIRSLSEQLAMEKRRSAQLTLLSELSQQLENQLDAPVASQLAVNTLQRSLHCTLAALYLHDPERRELVALATAGTRTSILPPGYRQSVSVGVLGRAARLRKTQIVNDARLETDFIQFNGESILSTVVVPMIDHGYLKAILEISDEHPNAFGSSDVQITEAVAAELLRAWERSEYHQRLKELIQAGISLTTQPDPQAAVQEVAVIARQTLRARFTFVTLLDQEGNFTRAASAGQAPRLMKSLRRDPSEEPLLQAALNAAHPFRVRDIRKYKHASHIAIDFPSLRSMIAIPIRMHRLSVGAILGFGKQGEVFFTENDESLASLLSSQAAAAIESAWLSHELRSNLITATQLYQLSFSVIQAQELSEAARAIAETAQKLCAATASGILLLTPDGNVEAEAQVDSSGTHIPPAHPMTLVQRAMESGQSIFLSSENETANICFPLKTSMRTYGALWLNLPDRNSSRFATNLQTLANQAALALERSILLAESRQQAKQLEAAYRELETTYDQTLAALISALDARDRETEGHSLRVAHLARMLGERLGLSDRQLKALERGSLLHDIGKIGISDTILHKPGPLDANEWKIMRLHPDIGARIVEGIPFLQDTLVVIRYHQERWDGSGYPIGLSGRDIPYLARIFAVADAFDALTSDRPYRGRIQTAEALQYLREQAGILFDPEIVQVLDELVEQGKLMLLEQYPSK